VRFVAKSRIVTVKNKESSRLRADSNPLSHLWICTFAVSAGQRVSYHATDLAFGTNWGIWR